MKTAKETLDFPSISFTVLGNGQKGIRLGLEDWFISVEKLKKKWKLRLIDLAANCEPVTGSCYIKEVDELRTNNRNTKGIRTALKRRYENYEEIIEKVIIELEENKEKFEKSEKSEKSEKQVYGLPAEEDVQKELEKILQTENHLEALNPYLDNLVVGEEYNKAAIFVLLLSSKYADPKMKQIILIKGTEGSGKTTLMRELTSPFKVKEVGRFSAHALDYTNFEGFEVLMLKELGNMDLEKQGISTLKFLSSDDRGYTVEVTTRDEETGRFTTVQYRIPPITLISSTTRLILDSQFERRAWIFNVNETSEQTRKVMEFKALMQKQEAEKTLGIRKYTDYELSKAVLRAYVEQLEPAKIIIPFPFTVSKILDHRVLRVRGDLSKIYVFIKLYALLNLQRLLKANDFYFVTPTVAIEALRIIVAPLSNMLSKLDERAKQIFNILEEMEIDKTGDVITKTDRNAIAVKLGKSERIIRRFLNYLEESGYVSSRMEGRTKNYTLLYSLETIREKATGILDILKKEESLMEEMQKEAQKWLENLLDKKVLPVGEFFSQKSKQDNITSKPQHDLYKFEEKKSPTGEGFLSNSKIDINNASFPEKEEENREKPERPICQTEKPKTTEFQCSLCNANFSTLKDLKIHLTKVHGRYVGEI